MGMRNAAIMSGVGQGAQGAANTILNAFFMKKKLDSNMAASKAAQTRADAEARRADAYTNWLTHQTDMSAFGSGFDKLQQWRAARQASTKNPASPGSTENQHATMRSMAKAGGAPAAPQVQAVSVNGAAAAPNPRPPAYRPPMVSKPAPPPIAPEDPRALLGPQQDDLPYYADFEG